jgi:hypothetical protein
MSCSMTIDAVRERRKTVTRRLVDTWTSLKPGDQLTLIEKGMGLPKGSKQVVLDVVTVVDVRIERLHEMLDSTYGWDEVRREGFATVSPLGFVQFWLDSHGVRAANEEELMDVRVRRIEWRYTDGRP